MADPETEPEPTGSSLTAALRPAWVEVDLDALAANLAALRRRIAPARVMAVLKADAYGHGAARVGQLLEAQGVEWIAVALLEEGAELRRAGVSCPILVLGTAQPSQLPLYRRYGLTPTVSSLDQLDLWSAARTARGRRQPLHLKVDTGMNRLGLSLDELPTAFDRLRADRTLRLTGLMTHFAEADQPGSLRNDAQEQAFERVLGHLTGDERVRLEIHLANSAAGLHRPSTRRDLVRFGLSLFGLDPAHRTARELEPVMSVVTRVVQVRTVPAGGAVGYGGRWRAERPCRIGVVPVGYADGYAWRLTDGISRDPGATALLPTSGGKVHRVPVVGSVTMDMSMIDLTDTDAALGDEVVLLGRRGDQAITAWDLADAAGTIPWELLCLLGLRMPRRYRSRGRCEELSARFSGSRGQGLW
ncbi:MAG: alanine racemase [Acidobacteriota bacterium]